MQASEAGTQTFPNGDVRSLHTYPFHDSSTQNRNFSPVPEPATHLSRRPCQASKALPISRRTASDTCGATCCNAINAYQCPFTRGHSYKPHDTACLSLTSTRTTLPYLYTTEGDGPMSQSDDRLNTPASHTCRPRV